MNKQALKLKQKRRLERENIKNENINKAWENMTKYSVEMGCKPLKKTKEQMLKVYKATKELDTKILNKTGVIAILCSLNVLYKHYNYTTKQLLSYANKLRTFILTIGKSERPIALLIDEIEKDYGVMVVDRCKNLSRLQISNVSINNMEETIIKSTVENFPYFISMTAYVFMNHLVLNNDDKIWNSKDLEIFISESIELYKYILHDCQYMQTLKFILINERCIDVDLTNGNLIEIIINKGE